MRRLLLLAAGVLSLFVPQTGDASTAIHGRASWYAYVPGGAAAGPKLRAALGPNWRGKIVTVHANGRTVRVRLTDWCQCYRGTATERLIDLDIRAFARLSDPASGLVKVSVTP